MISKKSIVCILVLSPGIVLFTSGYSVLKAENDAGFSFGAIADCQYCVAPNKGVRKYTLSKDKLKSCVDVFNTLDLEYVVHLGDFIDRDFKNFDVLIPIYNQLHVPTYHVLGNHDFSVADDLKKNVPTKMGLFSKYYDFEVKGWRYVVLDGNDISFHAYPEHSEKYEEAAEYYIQNKIQSPKWNGAIGNRQLSWLRNVIEKAQRNDENVIIFCHFPVFPENHHNLWNAKEVIALLESYPCVKAYINGHNHKGGYGMKEGIHYVTLKGMVETETNSYAVIRVDDDSINITGYGREKNRSLPISLPENPPDPAGLGLDVTTYAPGCDPAQFRFPTHMAFGPGNQEIVTDLKNRRFVFRDSLGDPFQISPVSLSGPHSVVYNPADGLYYANDTDNHRIIAFSDLSSGTIAAQTKNIAGIPLKRPHDIVLDPATGWIYAINPYSGHVFRFTAIGESESAISVPVQGYARALTFANGALYAIGSEKGRIVEIVDWDTPAFKVYDSFDPTGSRGPAGSWTKTGLVLNDAEFFDGFWYATSYFTESYASGTDCDENKFIRFKTLDDLIAGNWTDLSSLVPSGMTPYFLTVKEDKLYLAIFNHESPGSGDSILQFSPFSTPPAPVKNK